MRAKFIQQIGRIKREIPEETQKEKICLIEDIMKAKRCAVGMGLEQHNNVLSDPSKVFDLLYDLNMAELAQEIDVISKEISAKARILAGIDHE